jgi:uncharacterized RDD family membrane protein YckC
VVSSTVLLLTFWRRDPTANELKLPPQLALADPWRRALAGAIDVTPGLLIGTMGFDLTFNELFERWPGRGIGMTFTLMLPGLVAVAVIVGHTTLLELFTGRSLGKLATGLRVAKLDGQRPGFGPILARGLLKTFDLVAYLLLILPLISPYRQRLGDMVARTVVVMPNPDPDMADSNPADREKTEEPEEGGERRG